MPKRKDNFGDLKKYSVNIPMDDFLKIADMAKNLECIEHYLKRVDDQYVAMMQIYREMMEKIADIQRYL